MDRSFPDPPGRFSPVVLRHLRTFGIPALLGLTVGCGSMWGDSGCGSPPQGTDAAAGSVVVAEGAPPCTYSNQGVRGSRGRLLATITCPGTTDPFMVAVKMSGRKTVLVQAEGAGYGSVITLDAGEWEPPDTLWHDAEVVVDPLNLFKESNESNNRSVTQVRVIPPDLALNQYLTRVSDTNGNDVSTVSMGQPLWVIASANVGGWYQRAELSAKCAAFSFDSTVSIGSCDLLANGPPLVLWNWTPPAPGNYSVEFRVKVLSGEAESDTTNDVMTRNLTVTPGP